MGKGGINTELSGTRSGSGIESAGGIGQCGCAEGQTGAEGKSKSASGWQSTLISGLGDNRLGDNGNGNQLLG